NHFPDVAKHMDIYNLLKENYKQIKPFPGLASEDRREIIFLFMDQYDQLLNADDALNDIDTLNTKLLQIIKE
ncbi:MAG: hypothetical protein JST96_03105, partial [Bacteroidetes bacterium]|nr:hypothetical protein [Bacteroidota bacterium]